MRRALPGRQQSALVAALLEHANAFSSPCPSAAHKTSHHSCSSQMHTDAFSLCICLSVPTCLPISLSSRTAGRCRSACSVIRCTFLAFFGNILTLFPRLELKSFKNREQKRRINLETVPFFFSYLYEGPADAQNNRQWRYCVGRREWTCDGDGKTNRLIKPA